MSKAAALIAGHATFAAGMLSAIEQITGRSDVFVGLTNRALSAAGVEAAMREALDTSGATVVFTDLPAGSCTMAARRVQRERPGLTVVVGVNLATLLDFVFGIDGDVDAAARHAAEKGKAALQVLSAPGTGGSTHGP
jgi:PTS system N-acetylgalactosamine-specific IIA component